MKASECEGCLGYPDKPCGCPCHDPDREDA